MPITKPERYIGAMVGVLAGDALGAPYETWDATRIAADLKARGGLVPFNYPNPWKKKDTPDSEVMFPMGRPTDDSDHAATLGLSLIANNGLNEEDLYTRLRYVVFDHVSPLWSGKAFGAGWTTRTVLKPETFAESLAMPEPDRKWYPSNGSLMRSAATALLFGYSAQVDDELVQRMSRVTHRHPLSTAVCLSYVYVLCDLLEGEGVFDAVVAERDYALKQDTLSYPLYLPSLVPKDPGQWPERGAADFSYHVALWSLMTTDNFRDGITKAVSVGGDTDTYAAIAGGLLGAHYGIQGIPKEWRDILLGADVMEQIARDLYKLSGS